ncbi:MAG: efflux RND transporter periplasmic adaptor subunit [Candidatus Doudnabacteria bacterium]|nr:efflux RND transporter periplasmic adaptor subunit [Candidatus Doudnabacteria bacterium]
MNFIKSLWQKKSRLAITIIVLAVIGWLVYSRYNTTATLTTYLTAQAQTQTVISTVTGTGQVSNDRSVNITPQSTGKITAINFKQNDSVKAGDVIAIVDETNNTLSLNQAKAGLASAQAAYDQVMAGSTSQDIQLAQLTVSSDQQALANASSSLVTTTKKDAISVANALNTYLNSGISAIPSTQNIGNATIVISGNYTGTQQGTYNITIANSSGGATFNASGLESASGPVRATPVPLGTGGLYIAFSGTPSGNDNWTITIPNPAGSNFNSNYNAYETALNNQQSDLQSAQNAIISAQNRLQQDQINLQVKQQPPTQQQVESAQAQLTQAQSQVQNAQITYNNNILKAPFDGQVAQLNSQVGDQVGGSTVVATVVTTEPLAVVTLNEDDVAKIKLGDKATMTFNAIDGLTITGKVAEIDNIGTVSQGVVSYNVKISFDTQDPRIKPGMSVSAAIITDIQADVLTVPNTAVQTQGTTNYVLTLDPKQTHSVTGQTGIVSDVAPKMTPVQVGASDDTNTQIISGLTAGDTVVTQTINATAAKSSAASATSALRGLGGGGGGAFIGGGATRVITGGRPGG